MDRLVGALPSAESTVMGTSRTKLTSLLELRELMLQEAQQQEACSSSVTGASAVATPPEDTSGAGPPVAVLRHAESGGSLARSSLDAGGRTPPRWSDGPRRCDTGSSLQSAGPSCSGPQGEAANTTAAEERQPAAAVGVTDASHLPRELGMQCAAGEAACAPGLQSWAPPAPRAGQPAVSPRLSAQLARMCGKAVRFLKQLQRPVYRRTAADPEAPAMPKTALRFAKGLAFLWRKKAGLGAGVSWGAGFVVAQLPGGAWSAPSFLLARHASLGLTLGYQNVKYCHAIATAAGLQPFLTDSIAAGLDVALALDMDPIDMDLPVKTAGAPAPGGARQPGAEQQLRTYVVADGAMVDLSWRCGLSLVDDAVNSALYGPAATPESILSGTVQPPAEFQPLYELMAQMAAAAPVVRATRSQFELQKQRSLAQPQRGSLLEIARSFAGSIRGGGGGTPVGGSPGMLHRASTTGSTLASAQNTAHTFPAGLFPEVDEWRLGNSPGGGSPEAAPAPWTPGGLLFGEVELPPQAWEEGEAAGAGAGAEAAEAAGAAAAPGGNSAPVPGGNGERGSGGSGGAAALPSL